MINGLTEADITVAAKDAVEFARQHFQITLDYSEKSIEDVERILARYHNELPKGFFGKLFRVGPSPEKISEVVGMFGSYVGEVLRQRLQGCKWDVNNSSGKCVVSLADGNQRLWPHMQVRHRLIIGRDLNISHYFVGVIEHWNQKT